MEEIIKKADEFAVSEIEKYGLPSKMNYETSNKKGVELTKSLGADSDIVKIGTRLMDIKLGEAFSKGKIAEHVQMSVEATKDFLSKFDIDEETKNKIINCVEGHHGAKEWRCKEAEICANADCYRFLLMKNWLKFLHSLGKSDTTFTEDIETAEAKADEKWNILSISQCKKELENHYNFIKEIISLSKQDV